MLVVFALFEFLTVDASDDLELDWPRTVTGKMKNSGVKGCLTSGSFSIYCPLLRLRAYLVTVDEVLHVHSERKSSLNHI